jgi:hypothetical protein
MVQRMHKMIFLVTALVLSSMFVMRGTVLAFPTAARRSPNRSSDE